jgi:hypothetical protein
VGDPVNPEVLSRYINERGISATAHPGMQASLTDALKRDWDECIVSGSFKLFRDFDLALHHLEFGTFAVALDSIDPDQPWMRALV